MENKSSLSLLAIVIAFTLALLGLCARWDRIGLIAPFGDADLAAFIFIPLLLASLYTAARWFGFEPSMPTIAIRFASLLALAACIFVVTLIPAEPPTKLILAALLVAITIVLQITISRDWFPGTPNKRGTDK